MADFMDRLDGTLGAEGDEGRERDMCHLPVWDCPVLATACLGLLPVLGCAVCWSLLCWSLGVIVDCIIVPTHAFVSVRR